MIFNLTIEGLKHFHKELEPQPYLHRYVTEDLKGEKHQRSQWKVEINSLEELQKFSDYFGDTLLIQMPMFGGKHGFMEAIEDG